MNRNDYMTLSGADYIRAMFANTNSDGTLTLENEPEDRVTWYMDWSGKNVAEIVVEYEKLVSLHAPKIIIDNEAHYLAEELALYRGLQEFG